ncbi:MAG: DUF3604 domain-containing protein, partial [Bacteroidetes bacterium]|nr:DUF3604 domain-containing protein [Bacteroidota bacterium]
REVYGHAAIEPAAEVVAGSYGTWKLTYLVGPRGLAAGGSVRISTDSDTDWGMPQLDNPAGADYMTLETPQGARLALLIPDVKTVLLRNLGRALQPGEKLAVTLGDRSGGSPGSRAQTFQEARRYFWVAVDAGASGQFTTLADSPCVTITGGRAVRLVALVPSMVASGAPFRLVVRAEDEWGNPAAAYRGTVALQSRAIVTPVERHRFTERDRGVWRMEGCACTAPGLHRITAADVEGDLRSESNPLLCLERPGEYSLYWGDPHGGQVVMAEKIPDFFRYARDVAGVDFAGHQRNDHEMTNRDWALQQQAEREFHQPGRFIALPGFEWSGETERGGDHNVYFRRHDQPLRRSGHEMVEDKSDLGADLTHIWEVYQAYRNADVVITPHVGGRTADLGYHEPDLEPVIEVTSTHGSFEWFLEEALDRGYRVGFVGGSDGYTGRPGAEHPGHQERRYARGGLTAVYARSLTVEGILEALKARRCYGTTGARILVQTRADGHFMGEQYSTASGPEVSVLVAGTAPLESVELFRGRERLYSHPLGSKSSGNRVRVLWEGASRKTSYSGIVWDGSLKLRGGKIAGVEKVRFDSPRSRLLDFTPAGVRWHSVTCGYRSGIVVETDSPDSEYELTLEASLITGALLGGHGDAPPRRISYAPAGRVAFRFRLGDLEAGPKVVELGSLGRRVIISMAPQPGSAPSDAEFTFVDPSPRPGVNPYWLRVVQADMEMAWASPIFVDFVAT